MVRRIRFLRRFQFLRILKWAGTLTCLVILAAFAGSAWCIVRWCPSDGRMNLLTGGNVVSIQTRREAPAAKLHIMPRAFDLRLEGMYSGTLYPSTPIIVVPL